MASYFVKRGLWLGLAVLALIIGLTAAASVFAGSRILKANLFSEIESLTGRRLTYADGPVIKIFPSLTAEFRDLKLHDWKNASDMNPAASMPVLRLSLSLVSAIQGKVRITGAALEKPQFYLKETGGLWQFPFSAQARLPKLIAAIQTSLPESVTYAKAVDNARDVAFGLIKITDGKIIFGTATDHTPQPAISTVNAQLLWLAPGKNSNVTATGNWLGEQLALEINTTDTVMLFAGADTRLDIALESTLLKSQFAGTARLAPTPYFEGDLRAETSSLATISKWQRIETPMGLDGPGLSITGTLKADAGKWQLENSELLFGTNSGSGGLTFLPLATPPSLSGTVDFDILDLAMAETLFSGSVPVHANGITPLAVDLRVSADTAAFGTLSLNNVAASIQLTPQTSALDINDASVFGGTLQLALKRDYGTPSDKAVARSELRVLANNIETKKLSELGVLFGKWPDARGTVSAIFRGPPADGMGFFETAEGTIKFRLSEGTLPGIDGPAMLKELRRGGFITLGTEGPSSLAFNELNAEASLVDGTLQISPFRIGLDNALIDLSGAYAFDQNSVAMTGRVMLEPNHPEAEKGAETLRILIGGNSNAPLMSALPAERGSVEP